MAEAKLGDEADLYEAMVANERVEGWMDALQEYVGRPGDPYASSRAKRAAQELAEAATRSAVYEEEAVACGAPATLEAAMRASLSRGAEERLLSALSASLASLCGEGATQVRVRSVRASTTLPTVLVREGALRDGLGARLWGASFFLCRVLSSMDRREMAQETVLELGTGVGLLGCVAALCGAPHVVMSDGEEGALQVARETMALYQAKQGEGMDDAEAVKAIQRTKELPWEVQDGALCVRRLDWRDDRRRLEAPADVHVHPKEERTRMQAHVDAPVLSEDASYSLVIGSELLYDVECAEACAASCARRVSPGGRAHVVGAVRDHQYLAGFLHQAHRWNLRTCVRALDPNAVAADADGRTLGLRQASEYEGGYVEIFLDHRDAPHDWKLDLAFHH
eukprot:jgi/Pico_ML_1/56010/g1611.t1